MAIPTGTRLGSYEVSAPIGAGGMGEVYQAHDTKLGRDVAIKVLPEAFSHDPERLSRFRREAKMLASLNHPNIATIHGLEESDGRHYLVMELVPGETLAQRVRRDGAIPIEEALAIARQIAEALESAHNSEKGIIHRDLKPANVKVTPQGRVKVLDFGLAKAFADEPTATDIGDLPTLSMAPTEQGLILGTAAYMSPEQARGKPVDKRADIWAFGCLLYELLAGRMAFRGETFSDTLAAVIEREPDWQALPPTTPAKIRDLLQRCLQKDPQRRLRDIGEARIAIEATLNAPAAPRRSHWPVMIASGVGGVILLVLAVLWFGFLKPAKSGPPPTEYVQLTDFNDSALAPALSPDGRMLTFIRGGPFGSSAPRGQIYVKILPKGEPVQLTHNQSQREQPTFSPDGSRIIYTELTAGFKWDSWQVPVLGGTPQPFLANASGLVWTDEGHVLYSEIKEGVHMGIVASTENQSGKREIYLPPGEGSMVHRSALSPDHKWFLAVEMDGTGWLPCRLVPFDGSSPGRRVGPQDGQCTTASWSPDGRWMYFSSNASGGFHIWRQKYPDGAPEQITFEPTEQEGTAVTPDGKYLITSMGLQQAAVRMHDSNGDRQLTSEGFAMLPSMAPSGDRVFYLMQDKTARAYVSGQLWSLNPATNEKELVLPGYTMANYSISRDGKKVVFTSVGREAGDGVWIADLDRRSPPRQLTRGSEFRAFFGAPGEIVYMNQAEVRHLYRMKEDGSGNEMISPDPVTYLIGVSPDGNWAVASSPQAAHSDGSKVQFFSTHGGKPFLACDTCILGFGPGRQEAPMFTWSADGKSLFMALKFFGLHTQQTVVLPYRSGRPLETIWPKGLKSEKDVIANPGARVISEADAFPGATPSAYLFWRRATQSNLYRIPLPN